MKCTAFFISDSTGITAETFGNSLLMQFETIECERITLPYINTITEAEKTIECINQTEGLTLVFSTVVEPKIRQLLLTCQAPMFDIFDTFLKRVEDALHASHTKSIGRLHSVHNPAVSDMRIAAVQYTLNADDGGNTNHYDMADVILLGVSRSGKTPTCLYMALRYGISVANFPLTEEVLKTLKLPAAAQGFAKKLFGLTIDAKRLHELRTQRYGNSQYASIERCQQELKQADKIFRQANIPVLDTTDFSIEEIATKIIHMTGIKPHHHI